MRYGTYWACQRNSGLSLGIHVEWRSRMSGAGVRYGPYVDLHLIQWVVSIGVNPIYAGELHLKASFSRGGLAA